MTQTADELFSAALNIPTRDGERTRTGGYRVGQDCENSISIFDVSPICVGRCLCDWRGRKLHLLIFKYPSIKRDLALLLDKKITFAEVEKVALESGEKTD